MVDEAATIIQKIEQEKTKFIDLRFTDLQGKFLHISISTPLFNEDTLLNGIILDSSSIPGWDSQHLKLLLIPDMKTMHIDPFYAQSTIAFICNVYDPVSLKPYNRDPRYTAQKAIDYLQLVGIGDTLLLGITAEFFIFDSAHCTMSPIKSGFSLESTELSKNETNKGYIPNTKSGYTLSPEDKSHDLRSEIVSALNNIDVQITKYQNQAHDAQHSFSLQLESLLQASDNLQKYKYSVHQVANSYCKTATFMPKPLAYHNGSSMYLNMSIHKGGKEVFAGNQYEGLSETCLYYLGGIIKHAKALNAFTNPSTNSYKRLLSDHQSPIKLSYSMHNNASSCRIPLNNQLEHKNIEIRFADPSANPYLASTAILMAGLDGIAKKIHPGKNFDELSLKEQMKVPKISSSLRESLKNLNSDREFLKVGNVFDDDQIDAFINLKNNEVLRLEQTPCPIEFEMYYSI
ncbi:type I glutamate--ammonia ligase [Candidatus Liberibacter africanus]|uniref:Glutamine synthetase protein n=1 Tax=Candidatus Liberibacter africanus PTSAPSY TaxID=1277257 RepID=A0A0G3I7L4_LIBAF|nr:type I glutamate--ammonia ligase [Candidatus Liberibacter africanus]AKK19717.1 glutamine synthetase protein [Candidatus Liberibacter africanus PTSAPSY]QTP63601.1 type I glutamate--ammonia ligase [Candidatus Liberibacter africanus]